MKEVLILENTVEPKVAHALLKRIPNIKLVGPDKNNRYQVWATVPFLIGACSIVIGRLL